MSKWKDFEIECCNYLNNTYGNEKIRFDNTGGSDSNSPDIRVFINDKNEFNIEVKSASAQSGQFVVLDECNKFVFSSKNKSEEEDALPFIEYMNENYDKYKIVSESGIEIEMDAATFNNWIIRYYLAKRVNYVITKGLNGYVIFPTIKYGDYFNTTSVYRIKKSGSCDVSKVSQNDVMNLFSGFSSEYRGKKLIIASFNTYKKRERLKLGNYDYMVSEIIAPNKYYIRRLSNTRNANVIFSVSLKKDQNIQDLENFKESLK